MTQASRDAEKSAVVSRTRKLTCQMTILGFELIAILSGKRLRSEASSLSNPLQSWTGHEARV